VIIAVFNGARYIRETCRSALNQTYAPLELIVVDDGSTDGTGDIVRAIAASDRRVRLITQSNLGVAEARNRGLAASTGEFIAPLDADDLWAPTKLEKQVQRLLTCGCDAAMAYCWWAWIDTAGRVLDRSPSWRIEGHVVGRLAEVNFTGSASVPLYRRSILERVGGYDATLRDRGSQGCEDWDLALRVAERYQLAVVPEVLVGYRRRTDAMSSDYESMWRSQAHVIAGLAARQPSLTAAVLRRSSGQFALHLAGVAFWSREYLQACRWALRARPLTLTLAVMPHVMRMLTRRLLGRDGALVRSSDGRFNDLPPPLVPYDRIYARHWSGQRAGTDTPIP
jgi:glycosyltransferase involved in cell wall biosynthesis